MTQDAPFNALRASRQDTETIHPIPHEFIKAILETAEMPAEKQMFPDDNESYQQVQQVVNRGLAFYGYDRAAKFCHYLGLTEEGKARLAAYRKIERGEARDHMDPDWGPDGPPVRKPERIADAQIPEPVVQAALFASFDSARADGREVSDWHDWEPEDQRAAMLDMQAALDAGFAAMAGNARLWLGLAQIPEGWYLAGMHHRHTHPVNPLWTRPYDRARDHLDPWLVSLRCKTVPGLPVEGTGETAEVALAEAIRLVQAREQGAGRG